MSKSRPNFITLALSLTFVFSLPITAWSGIRVVSDIDDTTKITHVDFAPAAAWNGLFFSRAFTGMKELYTTFSVSRGYQFEYLSAASSTLHVRVKKFLNGNGFPKGTLHLKPALRGLSAKKFKTNTLLKILADHPADQFIFIGDDTQSDPQVYDSLYRMHPERILAIYIRRVKNQPLPPSVYPFFSAFDLARTELQMDRMEPWEIAPVALAIIGETRDDRILPRFNHCPGQEMKSVIDPDVEGWNREITRRIRNICDAREKNQ